MTQDEVAVSMLALIGGMGAAFLIVSLIGRAIIRRKNRRCTASAAGKVVKHCFPGNGRMYPKLEFAVRGQIYVCKKQFNGIIKTSRLISDGHTGAWEDEKGCLHIVRAPVTNMWALADRLWPIGSTMEVHYDPENPGKNYAGRPITYSFFNRFMAVLGVALIGFGILMYVVIR